LLFCIWCETFSLVIWVSSLHSGTRGVILKLGMTVQELRRFCGVVNDVIVDVVIVDYIRNIIGLDRNFALPLLSRFLTPVIIIGVGY
jgi:hypothetical protein